mgnify:FL=1
MSSVRLLALAGSTREGSYNQRLADLAASAGAASGIHVTPLSLARYDLPLYSDALERSAFPEAALALKAELAAHDGFLIATPEHNGSIPAVLKNAIDWASRPTGDESLVALTAFRGKVAGLMSASPSPFGGLRALAHLRQILSTIQTLVVTEQVAVPAAHLAFEGAALKEELPRQLLNGLVRRTAQVAAALKP